MRENNNLLKVEIEQAFGKKIQTAADCILLSLEVFKRTGHKISQNTLRRFFELIKSSYLTSHSTLNILSEYCGYANYQDVIKNKARENGKLADSDIEFLRYIVTIFKSLEKKQPDKKTIHILLKTTIQFLRKNTTLINIFQKEVSKTSIGQTYYFEQFIQMDYLNSYYGDGLYYYLAEKETTEAKIFANSLLALRFWLVNDLENFKKHCSKVLCFSVNFKTPSFISARYFATKLLYAESKGESDHNSILIEARAFYAHIKPSNDFFQSIPCYELVITETLLMIGEESEAQFYIDSGKNRANTDFGLHSQFLKLFDLFMAWSLAINGELEEARRIIRKINPHAFSLFSKKFYTLLFYQVKQQLTKNEATNKLIMDLIAELGYCKLLPGKMEITK